MLFVEKFSINIFLRFYSFMKKDSSPESNFFFFNRAWPEAQRRRNKHILGQQGSCWAWSFIEKKPIRRGSCVEHSGLGLQTPEINIWAEFPVQWHYKWCWTPLTDMPGLARACQTEILARGFVCSIPDYPGDAGAITVWGGFLKQLGQV